VERRLAAVLLLVVMVVVVVVVEAEQGLLLRSVPAGDLFSSEEEFPLENRRW